MEGPKHLATVDYPAVAVLVFVVFLVLKLAGAISWSWLWVTAPLWIGVAGYVALVIVFVAVMLGIWAYESWGNP